MEWIPTNRDAWLPELTQALHALDAALDNKRPSPELIAGLAPQLIDVIPDHRLEFHYLEHGYMYEPEDGDEPTEPEYVMTISGERLKVGWRILAANLPEVLGLSR